MFPRSEIEVERPSYYDTEAGLDSEAGHRVMRIKLRVSNREPVQRTNLVFEVETAWTPRVSERELRSRFGSHIESSRAYFPEVFPAIVELGPGSSREGFLVLEARASDPWLEFEPDGVYVDARKDCRFVMTVRDHVTGQSVAFDIPGTRSS